VEKQSGKVNEGVSGILAKKLRYLICSVTGSVIKKTDNLRMYNKNGEEGKGIQ
jgi:hypothetical protein